MSNHTESEIIQGIFCIIKPGQFKDMLINMDKMTLTELKSCIQSHLSERNSTELFQELMSTRQRDHETPQQVDVTQDREQTTPDLPTQIETLTSLVESLARSRSTESSIHSTWPKPRFYREDRPCGCAQCREQGVTDCPHCFKCGEAGHRAVGCLRGRTQGNTHAIQRRDQDKTNRGQ